MDACGGHVNGDDEDTARLSAQSLAEGDPTGWFERLYVEAREGTAVVPWDRGEPNALLVHWFETAPLPTSGRAMVVGCGLGRDAEHLASLGFATTAFDVSPTAIDEARVRHHGSAVHYEVADLLDLPRAWIGAFDLVVESHNVQALPVDLHARAIAGVASLVAPGGTLRVLAAVAQDSGPVTGPPWPLTRAEIDSYPSCGLQAVSVAQLPDPSGTSTRWAAEFSRPA